MDFQHPVFSFARWSTLIQMLLTIVSLLWSAMNRRHNTNRLIGSQVTLLRSAINRIQGQILAARVVPKSMRSGVEATGNHTR